MLTRTPTGWLSAESRNLLMLLSEQGTITAPMMAKLIGNYSSNTSNKLLALVKRGLADRRSPPGRATPYQYTISRLGSDYVAAITGAGQVNKGILGIGSRQAEVVMWMHNSPIDYPTETDVAIGTSIALSQINKIFINLFARGVIVPSQVDNRYCLSDEAERWASNQPQQMPVITAESSLPASAGIRGRQLMRLLGSHRCPEHPTAYDLADRLGMEPDECLHSLKRLHRHKLLCAKACEGNTITTDRYWRTSKLGQQWWRQDREDRGLSLTAEKRTQHVD